MERDVVVALTELGYGVVAQHRIGRFTVDAFLPSSRVIVEFQGDYFHCNPEVFPDGPTDLIQRNNVERDSKRIPLLESLGYRVVLIWESDVIAYGAIGAIERAGLGRVEPFAS